MYYKCAQCRRFRKSHVIKEMNQSNLSLFQNVSDLYKKANMPNSNALEFYNEYVT